MRIGRKRRAVTVAGRTVEIGRTGDGVVEIRGGDDLDLAAGLGLAHGHDRLLQMDMLRLAARGRLAECLEATDETFGVDVFMRDLGVARTAAADVERLDPDSLALAEVYAAGVNHALEHCPRPLELRLVRRRPEPWTATDTLATIGVMSYVGLAQVQQDMERLIVESIMAGADPDRLRRLLAPHLDGLDDEIVQLIRRLNTIRSVLPAPVRRAAAAPAAGGSNAWAVAGHRSATGTPLLACDPHLECNRLPAIWYEAVMRLPDDYRIGVSMPGVPGIVMGRTRHLAFGFTYGFMDSIDYFIEEVRDGQVRRGDGWEPVTVRTETVNRRGSTPLELSLRETDHGVLEVDPRNGALGDGLYLARAWTGHRFGHAPSLAAIAQLPRARDVATAQEVARTVTMSCNWVLADREGGIAFQQSGQLPLRRHSGVHPVPGWDARFAWQGLAPADVLLSERNPADGVIASANNLVNPPAGPLAVNLPQGEERVERIRTLLAARERHTTADFERIQLDLVSRHAERFMPILHPLLPDTPAGRLLAVWDLRYDRDSRAATLFEEVYREMLRRVFGDGLLGRERWRALQEQTGFLAFYHHLFDRVLLGGDRFWWGEEGREPVLREVLAQVLGADVDPSRVERWGASQRVLMRNLLLGGRLPRWLGFDHGPVEIAGCRGTVVQGGVNTIGGRQSSFAPSWRFVTDLGGDRAATVLAGGPSARRFSRWYRTDVDRWLEGRYKTLKG